MAYNTGLCVLERGSWLAVLDMLIKKHVFLRLPPHGPEAPDPGIWWLLCAVYMKNFRYILPGFRTVTTLVRGPLFDMSELYPFCYMGQKCSCVAPGKTLSNLDNPSQTPVRRTAPSLPQCTAVSILCPALYCLDRKRSVWVWCLRDSREPV